jgi:hypothetical protein
MAVTLRILVPALAVALIIASALGGCGSDEETTTTVAVVTSVTEGATTSTTVAPSTTSSSSTTSSVVTSESSTTTEASSTTTEALSSAETRLPNGNIKAMGYIDAAWEEGATRYISIDYAEMLTGQEAVDAAVEAGYIAPGEDLPNDYFIRNDNPQKREFQVADDASLVTVTLDGGTEEVYVDWEVFAGFWTEFVPEGAAHLNAMPWWIERDGDTVISITEQYLP